MDGRRSSGDDDGDARADFSKRGMDIHQQTGLAAGTIANDDELSAEFSRHGVGFGVVV